MNALRLSAIVAALLLAGTAAFGSPPGEAVMGGRDQDHWGDRHRGPDPWRFDWLDRSMNLHCRGSGDLGVCAREHRRDRYLYSYPYGFVLPPTGHEYLPDAWPFNVPVYPYPYWERVDGRPAPLEVYLAPRLFDCPEGVQRCHEEEWTDLEQEPR